MNVFGIKRTTEENSTHEIQARAKDLAFSLPNFPHAWDEWETVDESCADSEYLVPIKIGDPPQEFKLLLDTGSTVSWVNSRSLDEDPKHGKEYNGKRLFSIGKSSSKEPKPLADKKEEFGKMFDKFYGDKTCARGYLYTMTFDLGGNKFNGQPFGLCTEHEGDFYTDKELDGFLGFGIDSELKTKQKIRGTFQSIAQMLKEPTLGASLNHKNPGFFDFGHIPEGRYTGKLLTLPTIPPDKTSSSYWQIGNPNGKPNGKPNEKWFGVSWEGKSAEFPNGARAIVDTGWTGIMLPKAVAEKYYKSVPGYERAKLQRGGKVREVDTHLCDGKIPDLMIHIGDYTATIKGSLIQGVRIKKTNRCELQVRIAEDVEMAKNVILGTLFHQVTYVIYRLSNLDTPHGAQKISFGHKKLETSLTK